MRNGEIILLAVLNLYVRIKIRGAPLDTNHSVTDARRQFVAASIQKISDSVIKSLTELAIDILVVSGGNGSA
jgi:6-phosphofructokinase